MAGEWIECTLADACSSIDYGYTASAITDPVGPHLLRITDIVGGYIKWDKVPYVIADEYALNKYKLDDEDIVIARTGASTGVSAYVRTPPKAVFASYLVRLKVNKSGFVETLELGGITTYPKAVIHDEQSLPAAAVYPGVHALGNPAGPAV